MTSTIDSPISTDVPSREELVARAAELVPFLRSEILRAASGASAIHKSSPMQRLARDAAALKVHAIMSSTTGLELHGRALAGLAPNSPLL